MTDNGVPAAGAAVSATLHSSANGTWDFSGSTDSQGQVLFQLNHAPNNECYFTTVTSVTIPGSEWNQVQPVDPTMCIP